MMKKLAYKSEEAPTPWGIVNVPEEMKCEGWRICPKDYIECGCKKQNLQALELALKGWIPIRVEDQEKVKETIYLNTTETKNVIGLLSWVGDESKLYDIPDGMDFELKEQMSKRFKINNQTEGAIPQRFYILKANKPFYVRDEEAMGFTRKSKVEENLCSMCRNKETESQAELIDEIITIYSKWANNGDIENAEKEAFNEIISKFGISRK